MNSGPKVTIGMDVGDRYSHVVVLDDSGTVVLRDQIATTERAVKAWFRRFRGARVALEVKRDERGDVSGPMHLLTAMRAVNSAEVNAHRG